MSDISKTMLPEYSVGGFLGVSDGGQNMCSLNIGWQFWNDDPVFEQRVLSDIRNMLRRDHNRPSVWLWEPILNETEYPAGFARKAHETTHAEYPCPGEVIGGDMDGINPQPLCWGEAVVLVRAGLEPGDITVRAESARLGVHKPAAAGIMLKTTAPGRW